MDKIVCPVCSTENEQEYVYCKNCGAYLKPSAEKEPDSASAPENQQYEEPKYEQKPPVNEYTAGGDAIDGIPVADMSTFVGKKAYKIVPDFMRMQILGPKSVWCWPAAIWAFFAGPVGAAIWFMFRKMYKHAIIFAAIGIAMATVSYAVAPPQTANLDLEISANDPITAFSEIFEDSEATLAETIVLWIENSLSVAVAIVCGIFGWHWYKQHSVNKIYSYRAKNPDPKYYQFALCSMGGTSVGFAILFVVIYSALDTTIGEIIARVLGGV